MPSTDLIYRYLGIDAGAGAQFDRMGAKTAALGKTSDRTLASVKRLAVGVGVVGAVIGVEAVKKAAQFQTALTRIHTQADASTATVAKLRTGILAMASTVATAPTVLAQAAFHIASVGQKSLTTAQQLHILRIAAEGAKLGGADLVDVTNALDAAVVSGIRGVSNYSQAMGVLNATVGAGDMTMQDLAEAFGPLGAVLKGYNVNIREAGAALATFGDNNLRGAQAGTQLRMAVQALAVPVKTGQALLKSWGVSSGNLANQLRHGGLTSALDTLYALLKKNGVTSRDVGTVLTEAFGKRAGVGLSVLIGELDRFHNKLGEVGRGATGFGSSWAGYTKTFQFNFDKMRTAVETLAIKIGTDLLPSATRFVNYTTQHIIPAVTSVVHWMERNGSLVKTLAKLLLVSVVAWKAYTLWTKAAAVATKLFGLSAVTASGETVGMVAGLSAATKAGYGWLAIGQKISMLGPMFVGAQSDVRTAPLSTQTKWIDAYYQGLLKQKDGVAKLEVAYGHLNDMVARTTGTNRALWMQDRVYVAGLLKEQGVIVTTAGAFESLASATDLAGQALAAYQNYNAKAVYAASARHYVKPGEFAGLGGGKGKYTLPGGAGVSLAPITAAAGGGNSAGKSAAAVLHTTAKNLTRALAKGLLAGWQGYALTVRESLSTGTQHLLEQLGKQFEAIQKRMTTLVANAKTKLHDALTNERSYVQQMMSDAGLGNVPTVDSGYTGQTTRLTDIGAFLGSQAKNYALFDRLLRRLGHSGLSKGLVSQIAQMGPTQGIQYAQQILANPGQIAQINAYQKQIARSAKAIGQDQYGSQINADRKNLRRQTQLQERMAHRLDHLARDIGREVAANVHPGKGGISGKPSGLSVHEAKQLQRDLNKLDRLVGKKK